MQEIVKLTLKNMIFLMLELRFACFLGLLERHSKKQGLGLLLFCFGRVEF
jgi:hypothetical protein